MRVLVFPLLAILSLVLFTGCKAGLGNSRGDLSVYVTDAPIDEFAEVHVRFTGIEVKPVDSDEAIEIAFDTPRTIDLLSLQNGQSEALLENYELETGRYDWIKLLVNAEANTTDSYVVYTNSGGQKSLSLSSSNESKIQINDDFVIATGGTVELMIDFDLRKSLESQDANNVVLNPSLRAVNLNDVDEDSINGTITGNITENDACDNALSTAVYLYAGEVTTPNDLGSTTSPISSTIVDPSNNDAFSFHYLPADDYTVAITCQAANDNPTTDENGEEGEDDAEIQFQAIETVTVEIGETATITLDVTPEVTPAP